MKFLKPLKFPKSLEFHVLLRNVSETHHMGTECGFFILPTPKTEKQIYLTGFTKTLKRHKETKTTLILLKMSEAIRKLS
jgi:hypothetical protein